MNDSKSRLLEIVSLSAEYCEAVRSSVNFEKDEFINRILNLLPRIYWNFLVFSVEEGFEDPSFGYVQTYVDEEMYDAVRRDISILLGEDDVFLETFEEDMKYSDTPIAATISESLADIFQPLFNFISVVRESDGEQSVEAYLECHEHFESYWSQILCNVLRALNNLKFNR